SPAAPAALKVLGVVWSPSHVPARESRGSTRGGARDQQQRGRRDPDRTPRAAHRGRALGVVDGSHAVQGRVVVAEELMPSKDTPKTKAKTAKPALLSGGNPQITKAEGDAPVQT